MFKYSCSHIVARLYCICNECQTIVFVYDVYLLGDALIKPFWGLLAVSSLLQVLCGMSLDMFTFCVIFS